MYSDALHCVNAQSFSRYTTYVSTHQSARAPRQKRRGRASPPLRFSVYASRSARASPAARRRRASPLLALHSRIRYRVRSTIAQRIHGFSTHHPSRDFIHERTAHQNLWPVRIHGHQFTASISRPIRIYGPSEFTAHQFHGPSECVIFRLMRHQNAMGMPRHHGAPSCWNYETRMHHQEASSGVARGESRSAAAAINDQRRQLGRDRQSVPGHRAELGTLATPG